MVRKPVARVRAVLELVRPVVDEIVVAVDVTGDPSLRDGLEGVADRVLPAEPGAFNRQLGWLSGECAGDWFTWLEDDEVPGRDWLAALPALAAERGPTHVAFPRRWLHPHPA